MVARSPHSVYCDGALALSAVGPSIQGGSIHPAGQLDPRSNCPRTVGLGVQPPRGSNHPPTSDEELGQLFMEVDLEQLDPGNSNSVDTLPKLQVLLS